MPISSGKKLCLVLAFIAFNAGWSRADGLDGAQLYADNCAACHKPDGSGLATFYPALAGQAVVAGDPDTLIRVVVLGPANVLPADRPKFTGVMPPVKLSDAKLAALLSYVRDKFGKGAAAITEDDVAKVRTAAASK